MKNANLGRVVLTGLSVVSHFGETALANTEESVVQSASNMHEQTAVIDAQERLMVEGAWLKVPQACKDRSVTAEPRIIDQEATLVEMQAIHSAIAGVVS